MAAKERKEHIENRIHRPVMGQEPTETVSQNRRNQQSHLPLAPRRFQCDTAWFRRRFWMVFLRVLRASLRGAFPENSTHSDESTCQIMDAADEVHPRMGPGLLESKSPVNLS